MSILAEIFESKRQRARDRGQIGLREAQSRAANAPGSRGFVNALRASNHRPALIAEVKRASPSQGIIRPDFDPIAVAKSYARVGADALSVLTDEKWFQGSPTHLEQARQAVDLPILRKDFTASELDVWETRAMGADAILLIVAALDDAELTSFYSLARELGLDVLIEVHSQHDLDRALAIGAHMIGVNNRDLATFAEDIAVSKKLIPQIGARALKVSESALKSKADIDAVQQIGADAVLIGTAFCRELDVETAVRQIMGWPNV